MLFEGKISKPIHIKLDKNFNSIIESKDIKGTQFLEPGVIFNDEHYGFVLIIDNNGNQKEFLYPTQCKIDAVGIKNGQLKVFEAGKKVSWKFDKSGKLYNSAYNEAIIERSKFDLIVENYDMFMGKPILKNPICINIASDPLDSVILKDELIQEYYPLHPGVMLGSEHYGFILMIDTENGQQKKKIYPTQNRIDAVGIEGSSEFGDLKIFEKGKYHPWVFSCYGKIKSKSSYNQYSKNDNAYVDECYELNESKLGYFTLQKKK